jgi:hypothetical protein
MNLPVENLTKIAAKTKKKSGIVTIPHGLMVID